MKKRWTVLCLLALVLGIAASGVVAQKPAAPTVGVSIAEVQVVARGLSVKRSLLGKVVWYGNEKIGTIEDLIIAPDTFVSYAIVGVGGFLGIGRHDVAIPVGQFSITPGGKIVLPGATREQLEAMPKFEYAK